MARPDTDDGFVMIALELFAVLARYRLTDTERFVFSEVLMACYGPRKLRACHFDLPELERLSGIDRHNLRRALNGLRRRNMVADRPDGSLSPVKDYTAWDPAPDDACSRFGLSAVPRYGPRNAKDRSAYVGVQADPRISDHRGPGRPQRNRSLGSIQTPPGSIQTPMNGFIGVYPDPTHIEERASEELETLDNAAAAAAAGVRADATAPGDGRDPFGESGCYPGEHVPDLVAIEAAIEAAETLFPMLQVGAGILLHRRVYPSPWFGLAVRRCAAWAAGKGIRVRGWGAVHRFLKDWAVLGAPEPEPAPPAAAGPGSSVAVAEGPAAARRRAAIEEVRKIDFSKYVKGTGDGAR